MTSTPLQVAFDWQNRTRGPIRSKPLLQANSIPLGYVVSAPDLEPFMGDGIAPQSRAAKKLAGDYYACVRYSSLSNLVPRPLNLAKK